MARLALLTDVLALAGLILCPYALPQEPREIASQEASRDKAWDILRAGARARNFDKRANAIQALGLTFGDSEAVQLAEEIWVIHAFQKKSTQGIKTPKREIDLIKDRLKRLKEMLR